MLRRFRIVEDSMAPALDDGDWIIASRRTGAVQRGDVVIFDDPTGSGMTLVKRVIGLPGERVGIEGGRVTLDDAVLADRWANGATAPDGSWEIPADHVWVLADNRRMGGDSRTRGPIPITAIGWKAMWRYWPTAQAGAID